MGRERLFKIALAIGESGLFQVLGVCSKNQNIFGGQLRDECQTIKAIVLDRLGPRAQECRLKLRCSADNVQYPEVMRQRILVDVNGGVVVAFDCVRSLVGHLHAHVLQHR